MKSPTLFSLCAAALVALTAAAPQDDAEQELPPDEQLLREAEELVVKGKFKEARRVYAELAEQFPNTTAGETGARRSTPSAYLGSKKLVDHGPSENRVDIVVMGDGYELDKQKQFEKLAADVPPVFERQKTFREYYPYIDFHCAYLVSADDGVDGFGREYDTALNGHTTGTYAGHVGIDGHLVRRMLGEMDSQDGLAVCFVKLGVLGTGGGGFATIGGRNMKTLIHEWGHAFADLGDEYSSETHKRGGVGTAVNVSDTDDPERVPWKHWLDAKVPGVGIYEGASGQVKGAWKPTASGCVMQSGEFFCPPCREALVLRIYSVVDPIDGCDPIAHPRDHAVSLEGAEPHELRVKAMQPESHRLECRWYVFPEQRAPQDPRSRRAEYRRETGDRTARGPLSKIQDEPVDETRPDRDGWHEFTFKPKDYEPGRYRVVCRVKDTTVLRGERTPWVLKDEDGLLESERAWWIVVPGDPQ